METIRNIIPRLFTLQNNLIKIYIFDIKELISYSVAGVIIYEFSSVY